MASEIYLFIISKIEAESISSFATCNKHLNLHLLLSLLSSHRLGLCYHSTIPDVEMCPFRLLSVELGAISWVRDVAGVLKNRPPGHCLGRQMRNECYDV